MKVSHQAEVNIENLTSLDINYSNSNLKLVDENSVYVSTNELENTEAVDTIILEYTKETKTLLFENILQNPSLDETGRNW